MTSQSASARRFQSFADFWPFYVREHSEPLNRRLHFIGTASIALIVALAVIYHPYWLLFAPVSGYGFAWIGHFFVEKNRPATFIHPLWSLMGDFKMFGLMLIGKMDDEVRRCRTTG